MVFTAQIDWRAVGVGALVPKFALDKDTVMLIVAILGTTISPYLFFWQSSQEVEEEEGDAEAGPLTERPEQAPRELTRIGWETGVGMAVSNLVAFFIILTTAATLNANGRPTSRARSRPPRRSGRSRATRLSCCSAWASSAPACSPFRCSRVGGLCAGRGPELADRARAHVRGGAALLLHHHRGGDHGGPRCWFCCRSTRSRR